MCLAHDHVEHANVKFEVTGRRWRMFSTLYGDLFWQKAQYVIR